MKAEETCKVHAATELVGKKWTLALLQEIEINSGSGFNELMQVMKPISPKIMTERLQALEEQNMITRQEDKLKKRTAYALTHKGKELQKILLTLRTWSEKYDADMQGCSQKECIACEKYELSSKKGSVYIA